LESSAFNAIPSLACQRPTLPCNRYSARGLDRSIEWRLSYDSRGEKDNVERGRARAYAPRASLSNACDLNFFVLPVGRFGAKISTRRYIYGRGHRVSLPTENTDRVAPPWLPRRYDEYANKELCIKYQQPPRGRDGAEQPCASGPSSFCSTFKTRQFVCPLDTTGGVSGWDISLFLSLSLSLSSRPVSSSSFVSSLLLPARRAQVSAVCSTRLGLDVGSKHIVTNINP